MSKSIWKLQPLPKPSASHAADAIEIVNGETVRKVTLPQLDYDVYLAHEAGTGEVQDLMLALNLSADVITGTLHRLAAAGLVQPRNTSMLQ